MKQKQENTDKFIESNTSSIKVLRIGPKKEENKEK
jgi:hypothetical protein